MFLPRIAAALSLAAVLLTPACTTASTPANAAAESGKQLLNLQVTSSNGKHAFRVETAKTPAEQERGLMFRTELAADRGMLFPYDPPRPVSFWMKNTYIPLDMLFIRADGTIARIAENTVPESLDPVSAGEPVAAVLEIAGGNAAAQGIAVGDKVTWRDPSAKR